MQEQSAQKENLALLCKVWGMLKYYHPHIAKGGMDWDSALIKNIPLIQAAKNKETVNQYLNQLIKSAGPIADCGNCHDALRNSHFLKNEDFSWINQRNQLSTENQQQLLLLKSNIKQDTNLYVQINSNSGYAEFLHEKPYQEMVYPTESYRLLALFRYWNAINYFFAYRYLTDKNWDKVLLAGITDFIQAKNALQYHLAVLKTSKQINDSHGNLNSTIIDEYMGNMHPVFGLATIENKVVVQRYFNEEWKRNCPIKLGDILVKVNGKPIEKIIDSMRMYTRGSNTAVQNRNINLYLLRGKQPTLNITIERNGQLYNYRVNCYAIDSMDFLLNPPDSIPIWMKLPNNIGYIDMGELETTQVDSAMNSLMNTRAIIFDIRNYPQGTIQQIMQYLLPKQVRFVRFRVPDISRPGVFKEDIISKDAYCGPAKNNPHYYRGMVVVLMNEITQSHAEFTCMALQKNPNTVLIGSQTSGADGNQTSIVLPGNIRTFFTGMGVYYPDWRETQRIGIKPDIEMYPTIAGIKNKSDELLNRAIQYIETKK